MVALNSEVETIVAQATPVGRGSVGIVRISGPKVSEIAEKILGKLPKPREAAHLTFWGQRQEALDHGIALFFKGPNSFTGEDVLELQGHGGPLVVQRIIREVVDLGARLAQPGEFSLRAFLNDKMDLVQAEAVADLINAQSEQAARSAMKSLQGDFSRCIEAWVEALIKLRLYVEAAIDFPEEEIDFLSDSYIQTELARLIQEVIKVKEIARQGVLLQEGLRIAIAGKPNAGKSSLLNQLSGTESAIVTDIPGTTRDVLKEHISIDGLPLQLIDTAGLRASADSVEIEGIKRAQREIKQADHVLWMLDASTSKEEDLELLLLEWKALFQNTRHFTLIFNKIDLVSKSPSIKKILKVEQDLDCTLIYLSVKTGQGIELLKKHLKESVGMVENSNEGIFNARSRHLQALESGFEHLNQAQDKLAFKAGELVAEELRQAQLCLEEITGKFTSDDLLGRIFSEFCIGK